MIPLDARIMRSMFVVAVLALAVGLLGGMILSSPASSSGSNPNATLYCQDALARRAQAEYALSMPAGDPGAYSMARQQARAAYDRAVIDINRYCPAPR